VQKITPFLWYDGQAEEAARLYTSIFKNSRIIDVMRCGEQGPGPKGSALTVTFEIEGQRFMALNGGPMYKFTEAFSLFVDCESQAEVDDYWIKLTADGGREDRCGWLKDKFGVSWQIIPRALMKAIGDQDPARAGRAMQAMFQMKKIDIQTIEAAHAGP